ncbi:PH domain-containing protein [Natronomonas marina]|jgi:uncharacterized membrane protein YdbT with pleckstrin-like domain|uniref:PH domain-containing protein n=1 Tax=Natronomonas marina TaxID=2961939 RepID=UPI0020C97A5A|nr:PH domain-containing protein [Natronomonas marina]
MTDEWLRLEAGETVEWETRPRLVRAAPGVLVGLAVAAAGIAGAVLVDQLAAVLVVLAPLPAVYAYLRVVNTRYVLTDRALYRKRGVVGIDLRTVELSRVQNTRSTQGVLGAAFGHGSVEIEVAGGRDLRFADIYDPNEVRRHIEELGGGTEAIPGTTDQWRAVLEELRAIRQSLDRQPK